MKCPICDQDMREERPGFYVCDEKGHPIAYDPYYEQRQSGSVRYEPL